MRGYVDMAESFSEINKHKKSCEIMSKIREIDTVQWLCSCLLKIQVTCNYCKCGFLCSGRKITSWFLRFPSWFLISCFDFWFLTLISDFLPRFLISSLDFRFNVLISDFLTDFFSWCARFLCVADPSGYVESWFIMCCSGVVKVYYTANACKYSTVAS